MKKQQENTKKVVNDHIILYYLYINVFIYFLPVEALRFSVYGRR